MGERPESDSHSASNTGEINSNERLCDLCSTANLNPPLDDKIEAPIVLSLGLGKDYIARSQESCPLCRITCWMLGTVPAREADQELFLVSPRRWSAQLYQRFRFWDARATGLVLATKHTDVYDRNLMPCFHLDSGPWVGNPVRFAVALGQTEFAQVPATETAKWLSAARVQPSADLDRAKDWISHCLVNHQESCAPLTQTPFWPTNVIDCMDGTLIGTPQGCSYVSLSYVWGKPKPGQTPGTLGSLAKADLPLTIRDVMTVTLRLGYRYLWIDRYCIKQDDPVDKARQIMNMGLIYNCSVLTIVAAAGEDPDYGLPGVSERARQPQISDDIKGHTVVAFPEDPSSQIMTTIWSTRAWTYQEGLLSRRRLVFMDQQTYFECNTASCEECMPFPQDFAPRSRHTRPEEQLQPVFQGLNRPSQTAEEAILVLDAIAVYSSRALTFDSDYLNAMQGIFHSLSGQDKYPTANLAGVPLVALPRMLNDAWGKKTGIERKMHFLASGMTQALMIGLTWVTRPGRRRSPELFPSWSWTGWTGSVGWGGITGSTHPLFLGGYVSARSAWVENDDGAVIDVEELFGQSPISGPTEAETQAEEAPSASPERMSFIQHPKAIHIESQTFPVHIARTTKSPPAWTLSDSSNSFVEPGTWASWRVGNSSDSLDVFSRFSPCHEDEAVGVSDSEEQGSYKALVLFTENGSDAAIGYEGTPTIDEISDSEIKILREVCSSPRHYNRTEKRVENEEMNGQGIEEKETSDIMKTYEVVGHMTLLTNHLRVKYSTPADSHPPFSHADLRPGMLWPVTTLERVRLI
ncbi:TcdA/TcdB toxin- pore forming domain-containing protein [Apiospora arundinis]